MEVRGMMEVTTVKKRLITSLTPIIPLTSVILPVAVR